jgi:hypothetical protein
MGKNRRSGGGGTASQPSTNKDKNENRTNVNNLEVVRPGGNTPSNSPSSQGTPQTQTNRQNEGLVWELGLDSNRHEIMNYAKDNGILTDEIINDAVESGDHTEFERLMDVAEQVMEMDEEYNAEMEAIRLPLQL